MNPHKTGSPVGFYFAAHKQTDVRHECTTDGEKKEGHEGGGSSFKIHRA